MEIFGLKNLHLFMRYLLFFLLAFALASHNNPQKAKSSKLVPSLLGKGWDGAISDSALLDLVQSQTFKYFWDFADPVSGMARERSNQGNDYGSEVAATGGTGFGIMSIIVAVNRNWIA